MPGIIVSLIMVIEVKAILFAEYPKESPSQIDPERYTFLH